MYSVLVPSAGMLAVQSGCFAKVTYVLHGNNGDQESCKLRQYAGD